MAFAELLRERRLQRAVSLGALAERIHYDRGHVAHVESRRRSATHDFAEKCDTALSAAGALLRAWERDEAERQSTAASRRTLAASLAASRRLSELAEVDLSQLFEAVDEISVDYLALPPAPMLERASALRDDAVARLRDFRHGPGERADLYLAAGRLSGVLAYAALDLGEPDAALEHARAAARCASYAGNDDLLVWVRGTQSLISRFQGNYGVALDYVRDGHKYVHAGNEVGEARLLCGEAQSLANLGNGTDAVKALNLADWARDRIAGADAPGLFGFSRAKQRYYAASSLIWLHGSDAARRAADEAEAAIGMWQSAPPAERSLDDERLAHVYWATALVQQDDVEAAAQVLRPVLTLSREDRISWIAKRMNRLESMLAADRFRGVPAATDLAEEIQSAAQS